MSARYEWEDDGPITAGRKILLAQDSYTMLVDAIADMKLLLNGNNDLLEQAIDQARGAAEIHYDAEKDGYSDGAEIFVDPQTGMLDEIVPLTDWTSENLRLKED
jgi:hypothetical protein